VKVSISITTYNHEQFIAQALDSVLMQESDFDYEIVLGEDESQDRTREICIEYARWHPNRIRLFLRSRKDVIYINGKPTGRFNFVENLKAARGEYIALLDGDDYWTDPHKLQKQVDFLDRHPSCAICFHPVRRIYEDGSREPEVIPENRKPFYGLEDLVERNFVPTCSTMFRSGLFGDFPDWFHKMWFADWPLHVLNAEHGQIGCIEEVMGVYRTHGSSVIATRTPVEGLQAYLDFYAQLNARYAHRFDNTIKRVMADRWELAANEIAAVCFEQGSLRAAQAAYKGTLAHWPVSLPIPEGWQADTSKRMYALFVFEGVKSGDLRSVRDCLSRAISRDPALLRSLGMWSIALGAFLGSHVASRLRGQARKLWPWTVEAEG
jgi:glycosyltransferase involved in cell wall biosynthesis